MFKTRPAIYPGYEPVLRKFPCLAPVYGKEFDKETGREKVVVVSHTNFYEKIQAAKADTMIYNVIDRLERTGQRITDAEIAADGIVDTLSMPRNLMEAKQIECETRRFFEGLPAEVKFSKYQNSFDVFLKSVHDGLVNKTIKTRDEILAAQQAAKSSEGVTNE